MLRLIETEPKDGAAYGAYDSKAPPGSVTITPGSVELLSYALPYGSGGGGNGGKGGPGGSSSSSTLSSSVGSVDEQGVVIRLMGSRWTAPLKVPLTPMAAAAAAKEKSGQKMKQPSAPPTVTSYEPVVILARNRYVQLVVGV
jgi:hypothetical protein